MRRAVLVSIACVLSAAMPAAQFGGILRGVQKAQEAKSAADALNFTEAEERQLGSDVSERLREKYGVVQDEAVHRYVALVGRVLSEKSSRPNLDWTFIVLDTDGVNAFAAPGGFVHITRGALALLDSEAELAGVLGHEIAHVTGKHTINAVKKNNFAQAGASLTGNALLQAVANRAYEMLLENAYDRSDEMAADRQGVMLAGGAGYAPSGLSAFLTRLAERNAGLQARSGLFASHPETRARLEALAKVVAAEKLTATATVEPRFRQTISYEPLAVAEIAAGTEGAAGAAEAAPKKKTEPAAEKTASKSAERKSGGFGLAGLNPLSREKSSTQTVASAGSRGVNPDRDAQGGGDSRVVAVTLTAAQIADFRKGIV